jgi:threonine/homoserine/homoserine lactone efflux protein
MNLSNWLLYLTVVVLTSLTPGPAVLLAISNAISLGLRAAIYSSLGNVLGLLLLSAAAMAGVGAVFKTSVLIFAVLKTFGAAYLIYLGIRQWRSTANVFTPKSETRLQQTSSPSKLIYQGMLLALTNPKAILFFVALFPQFIIASQPLTVQFFVLTGTLMMASFVVLMGYAALANSAKSWLSISWRAKAFNQVCGSIFVLLGMGMLRLKTENKLL